jgi:hypothetical protein
MAMKKTSGGNSPLRQGWEELLDPPDLRSMMATDRDVFLEN